MARPDPQTLALRDARAYILRVLLDGKPRDIPGVNGMKDGMFILPRHPLSIQYRAGARKQTYVTGTMEKRADMQGVDPPVISVSLNFGERGAYDARSRQGMDGRASMRALEDLIRGYLKAVAERGRQRLSMHVLEWHDVYRGEAWVVVPEEVPYGSESNNQPYAEDAALRLEALVGVKAIGPAAPISEKLRARIHICPLNPGCKYGGPSVKGCPYRRDA